jgi:uncharacterized protein (DUF4415 family)
MNGKPTKRESSKPFTPEQQAELAALAAMADADIDMSDIPPVHDWAGAKRGAFYRPTKQQLTLRLDDDVVDWFRRRSGGKGYQTQINRALRAYINLIEEHQPRPRRRAGK